MNKQTRFILAIVFQVMVILAIIIFKLSVLVGGTYVLLRIVPLDPRDMLRGDYITFQYDISNIDPYYVRGRQIRNGDTVYVTLRQSGKYWKVQDVQKTKPTGGDLFIKGTVESGGTESNADPFSLQISDSSVLRVLYGIEQYFIPEGRGQGFSFWDKEVAAWVAVDNDGNPVLKRIIVDGNP